MNIEIEKVIKADVDAVWRAWTTPDDIVQWNAASPEWHCPSATIDLRPGGKFSYRMEARDGQMGFDFCGTFTAVTFGERIEFLLDDGRPVTVEFIPGEGQVTVRESFSAESEHSGEQQRQGWQAILNNFALHVESNS